MIIPCFLSLGQCLIYHFFGCVSKKTGFVAVGTPSIGQFHSGGCGSCCCCWHPGRLMPIGASPEHVWWLIQHPIFQVEVDMNCESEWSTRKGCLHTKICSRTGWLLVIGTPIDPSSNRRNNAVDRVNTELEIGRANFDPSPVNGEIARLYLQALLLQGPFLLLIFVEFLADLAMRCATLVASSCIDLRYEVGCPSAADSYAPSLRGLRGSGKDGVQKFGNAKSCGLQHCLHFIGDPQDWSSMVYIDVYQIRLKWSPFKFAASIDVRIGWKLGAPQNWMVHELQNHQKQSIQFVSLLILTFDLYASWSISPLYIQWAWKVMSVSERPFFGIGLPKELGIDLSKVIWTAFLFWIDRPKAFNMRIHAESLWSLGFWRKMGSFKTVGYPSNFSIVFFCDSELQHPVLGSENIEVSLGIFGPRWAHEVVDALNRQADLSHLLKGVFHGNSIFFHGDLQVAKEVGFSSRIFGIPWI